MGHANDADTDSIIGNALDEAFHIGEDDSSTDYKDIYTVSTDMLDHLDKIQKGKSPKESTPDSGTSMT